MQEKLQNLIVYFAQTIISSRNERKNKKLKEIILYIYDVSKVCGWWWVIVVLY